MIDYLIHMARDDIKNYGLSATWYNVRFMLAWNIASFLTGDLKRMQTGKK